MLLLIFLLVILTPLLLCFINVSKTSTKSKKNNLNELPKPYPIIGHLLAFYGLKGYEIFEWLSKIISTSPSSTVVVHHPFGRRSIYTGNPANVEHILKTRFHIYEKGLHQKAVFGDVFGDSLFTMNGEPWKVQRQIVSIEFTHVALQRFAQNIVKFKISESLIPMLTNAAKNNKVIDLQDILQRFAFDNICEVTFGFDPGYLSPSLPDSKVPRAFDESISICHMRFNAIFPIIWKACRFLNIGSERRLKDSVRTMREFTKSMINASKQNKITETQENVLVSRLLKDDRFDEKLVIDIFISFIFAGRDTSSSALSWFFWLIHKNNHVEKEIISEITNNVITNEENTKLSVVVVLKGMTYTHAALSETMRLYPPVAVNPRQASKDDVLPDGTKVKKGVIVGYHAHAMGRSEKIWGPDWPEFRPERWLRKEEDEATGKTKQTFVPHDSYSYPVFHAGPRMCLGKDMAFLQMKSVIAAVLSRFKVVPAGNDPVYVPESTARMRGGFPVRIEERVQGERKQVD